MVNSAGSSKGANRDNLMTAAESPGARLFSSVQGKPRDDRVLIDHALAGAEGVASSPQGVLTAVATGPNITPWIGLAT